MSRNQGAQRVEGFSKLTLITKNYKMRHAEKLENKPNEEIIMK
jgi:hypothetical protein